MEGAMLGVAFLFCFINMIIGFMAGICWERYINIWDRLGK